MSIFNKQITYVIMSVLALVFAYCYLLKGNVGAALFGCAFSVVIMVYYYVFIR